MPEMMRCIEISQPGLPEVLRPAARPRPEAGPGEVLIRVLAAGVNRPDVIQRQGKYPPPPGASDILGLEIAGEVVALGQGVTKLRIGDRVCALVTGGGYAEFCTANALCCLPMPQGFDMIKAAALPETYFTVWHNLFQRAGLRSGETILIHGGSSGIGTTAIQLAKAFGAVVLTTAGTPEKCRFCEELGASRAIDYRQEDFVQAVKDATEGRGVDVVLDMVGGDYIARNIASLAADGRLVNIAFLKGSKAEIDFMPVMLKRLTLTGSTLRPRSAEFKARVASELKDKVWPLLDSAELRPIISATYPLDQAVEAHRLMESSAHIGKIVLTL